MDGPRPYGQQKMSPYNSLTRPTYDYYGSPYGPPPNGNGLHVPRPHYNLPNNGRGDPYKDDVSETASEKEGDNSGSPSQGIMRLFSKFADRCSLNGVPFIKESKSKKVKVVWSCLLMIAIGAMVLHLFRLFQTFFDYDKSSKITLTYNNLEFPAITICNVNAVRNSQLVIASPAMQEFVAAVNPERMVEQLDDYEPEYEDVESIYDEAWEDSENEEERRKKRQTSTSINTTKVRTGNFLDDADFLGNVTGPEREDLDEDFYNRVFEDSWEAEATVSTIYGLEQDFKHLFTEQRPNIRAEMGHQMSDMLLQCSFAGRKCVQTNFTRLLTTGYGNCYTLEYKKFVSRKSGPSDGLELALFLETDEYIPGVTNSKGAQLVIHDQKTIPFPDDEGISISAGTETMIGLRQLVVERLGDPYGHCTTSDLFEQQYGIKYTRTSCQRICEQVRLRTRCSCFDQTKQEINKILRNPTNLVPCKSKQEMTCLENVKWRFQENVPDCGCNSPCSEKLYEKTISSRQWPNQPYAELLKRSICTNKPDLCPSLEAKREEQLRDEFVKIKVFYEDLNYEELEEQEDYGMEQFLSDIGGTIGLWIGLSILSICELFHLLTNVMIYICGGRWKKNPKSTPTNRNKTEGNKRGAELPMSAYRTTPEYGGRGPNHDMAFMGDSGMGSGHPHTNFAYEQGRNTKGGAF